ncbi:MAG: hypothetical protein ABI054_12485 [Planctomycetota bacterium]
MRLNRTWLAAGGGDGETDLVRNSGRIAGRRLRRWLGLALIFGLAAAFTGARAFAQRPKEKAAPTLQLFAGSMKQACARAQERNVPIVAIMLLEDEPDNQTARADLLASADLAALSQRSLLLFSNTAVHKLRELTETVDGAKRTRMVCSSYGTASCKEHQQHWDDLYNEFNQDGEMRCPQVLVLTPDGKLADRVSPGHNPRVAAIVDLVKATQDKLGRGLDDAALALVKEAMTRGARAESAGKSGTCWHCFGEVLAVAPDGPRAQAAIDGQKRAVETLTRQREAAVLQLSQDSGLAGYLALEELARDWQGSDQALELARLMKAAEKEPALRDALAKKRREDAAQALWNEAAALQATNPKEAERKLRLLLKKYAGTEAYGRAAKAHPDWVTS